MKNTCKLNIIKVFYICIFTGVFFMSCGLDVVDKILVPVTEVQNNCTYYDEDFSKWFIQFETSDRENKDLLENSAISYNGVSLYYKIYDSKNTLSSEKDGIYSLLTASNGLNSYEASSRLLSTYNYQPMQFAYYDEDIKVVANKLNIVSSTGKNINVYLRLTKVKDSTSPLFMAGISYPYKDPSDTPTFSSDTIRFLSKNRLTQKESFLKFVENTEQWYDNLNNPLTQEQLKDYVFALPARSNGNSFNFFDDDDTDFYYNKIPETGDSDYSHTSSGDISEYYVMVYAIVEGFNSTTLDSITSTPCELGSFLIKKR